MLRWYRGDLHAHSTFSDGVDAPEVVLRRARENGLEFFALTDHRTVEHLRHLPDDCGLTLIPGFEFGDRLGHANLFGITRLLGENRSLEADGTRRSLREARDAGASIAINHPFHYESTWRLPLEGIDCDWIELWNGPWFNSNQPCLRWWQERLCEGKRIPVAGGSDCHGNAPFHYYGQPTTWVRAPSRGAADILAALKAGHTVLSYSPDGPFIDLTHGNAIVGDEAGDGSGSGDGGRPFLLEVSGLVASDIVKVVSDRGTEREAAAGGATYREAIAAPGRRFLRVEVHRWFSELLTWQVAALSNPVYLRDPGSRGAPV